MDAQLWRGLSLLRSLALAWSGALAVWIHVAGDYAHPERTWIVIAAMAGWTVVITRAQRTPAGRTWPWLGADLVVAVAVLVATTTADTPMLVAERSLPVLWAAVPALAAALAHGLTAGLASATIIVATTALVRGAVTGTVVANGVLLVFSVVVLGWVADLARSAERERILAEEVRARDAERRRIGRIVHDGVLQVLAQVAHRAPELGHDGQSLAAAAAEQEIALRRLVAGDETGVVGGEVDLAALVATLAAAGVTVSPPAEPVMVGADLGLELDAAVRAALDNVRRHAPGAHAWVLLEDDIDEVRVVVRDDGPGFEPSRLDEAQSEGRLGVSESIRGRLRDLGGSASVRSTPGAGVVVELVAPRSRRD